MEHRPPHSRLIIIRCSRAHPSVLHLALLSPIWLNHLHLGRVEEEEGGVGDEEVEGGEVEGGEVEDEEVEEGEEMEEEVVGDSEIDQAIGKDQVVLVGEMDLVVMEVA